MRELALLLNVKAHGFLAGATDRRPQSILKNLASFLIFGGVALGVFFLARGVTAYMIQQAHIGQFLYHRFLSMLLYVFFITVNLGNMIVCYATLYRSEEVGFLMGMPLSHQKIFLIKFVDNFFYSSSTLTMLGLSWLLGYGSFFRLPWYFYFFTMFAVMVPFMLIAGLTAVMFLMVLIRIAVRVGVRWLLAMVAVVYLGAIVAYFRVTNPALLVEEVMRHYPYVNEYFGYLDAPLVRFLPNHWVAEFLYWSVHGDWARAFPHFFTLIITLAALSVVAGWMARRFYYPSWLAASDARSMGGERPPLLRLRFMEFGRAGVLGPQSGVLVRRDFWSFVREPSQWLHLVLMLILLGVFLVSVGSLELRSSQPFLQVVSFLAVLLFIGFLVASVSLRFVFPAVSLEGSAFWAVRAAPVSLRRLYWYKVLHTFVPVFAVGEVLGIVSIALFRGDPLLVAVSGVTTACIVLALTGLNLGAGAVFASYYEKNPIRIASSQGASLSFLASMMYLSVVIALLILPLHGYFEGLLFRGMRTSSWIFLPLGTILVISSTVFAVSTAAGLRAIRRDL
jgi:ABC-2 type transport system permease protein